MSQRSKLVGLLTPIQTELLKTLFQLDQQTGPRYWKPKDLGGFRSSHHAVTLKRMHEKGLVERAPLSEVTPDRNFGYRITEAGRQMWQLLKEMSQIPLHAVFGGPVAQDKMAMLARLAIH